MIYADTSMGDRAVCAIFLREGHDDARRDPAMDEAAAELGGYIEWAIALADWSDHIAWGTVLYLQRRVDPDEGHPGVLAYEVWAPMGEWLVRECVKRGRLFDTRPLLLKDDVDAELTARLDEFFTPDPKGASDAQLV